MKIFNLIFLKFRNFRNRIPFGLLCIYIFILGHFVLHGDKKDNLYPLWWPSYVVVATIYFLACDVRLSLLTLDYIKPLKWFAAFFIFLSFVTIHIMYAHPTMINYSYIMQIILILMSIYIIISRDIRESGDILQETSDCKGKQPSQRQMRIIEIPYDFENAFERCIASMDNYQLSDSMGSEKKGTLKTISCEGGSDVISFKLKRIDDRKTMVVIKSQILSLTIDRDGRNYKRIEEIVKYLK